MVKPNVSTLLGQNGVPTTIEQSRHHDKAHVTTPKIGNNTRMANIM